MRANETRVVHSLLIVLLFMPKVLPRSIIVTAAVTKTDLHLVFCYHCL